MKVAIESKIFVQCVKCCVFCPFLNSLALVHSLSLLCFRFMLSFINVGYAAYTFNDTIFDLFIILTRIMSRSNGVFATNIEFCLCFCVCFFVSFDVCFFFLELVILL